ncbi:hypothetical protein CBR_g41740 [Chara braunii]|uniref:Peptidase A2 domain-containing protein n=1 Tax=Chara braunii TaxID=69332 RepID=A0A388LWH1_CHABU|nr:hypothetical protein CBR_g41740 [Chara braunii]|eukprot:GBG86678.1 hypothetical protein CBR_g41740 [Chara braunii]
MAADWPVEAANGKLEESGNKISLLLSHLTDLLATCIAQQEDIHNLDDEVQTHNQVFDQLTSHLQQLEQTVAAPVASSSNTFDRLEAFEIDVGSLKDGVQLQQNAMQQLEEWICTATTHSRSEPHETTPKFDDQEILYDSMKTDLIPWFRKFELKLQLHYVIEHKHHAYLYSRSGGACQAWLDNLLSKYGVLAVDLHTKISWDDLKTSQGQIRKLRTVGSKSTTLSAPSEPVTSRVTALRSEAHAEVDSPLLYSFEDYVALLIPTLGTHAQGQDVCATSSPSGNDNLSSSSGSSWDSVSEFNIEALDSLTSEDFAWLPLPTTGLLPRQQCAALWAHLHTYLSFYAPPTSSMDDEVAVGDILVYVTKGAREFHKQRYDDNNAPLLYVYVQVGQASCSASLDSGASRNFMSLTFMQKVGIGAQVRRKANWTTINLADERTQQLIDHYIEVIPVYFAPHACKPVTFGILDTDFDMPWLASADHMVNFHLRTLTVRDVFGAEVIADDSYPTGTGSDLPGGRCDVTATQLCVLGSGAEALPEFCGGCTGSNGGGVEALPDFCGSGIGFTAVVGKHYRIFAAAALILTAVVGLILKIGTEILVWLLRAYVVLGDGVDLQLVVSIRSGGSTVGIVRTTWDSLLRTPSWRVISLEFFSGCDFGSYEHLKIKVVVIQWNDHESWSCELHISSFDDYRLFNFD